MTAPLAALLLLVAGEGPSIPPLTGPVVDLAGVLSASDRAALDDLARQVRAERGGQGVQLGFLTIPSLNGVPIEDFSIRVAEAWHLGSKGADNGLLFVVAKGDRRARIEVGGGLEGRLTDLQADRLIVGTLAPAFREGRYGEGLLNGAREALRELGAGPAPSRRPYPERKRGLPNGLVLSLWLGLWLVPLLIRRLRGLPPSRGGFWIGSGLGGGSGGGGWSGGGGGFSGGGASGGW